MKSYSTIPIFPSLVITILFLISIADPTVASSSNNSLGSLKNETVNLNTKTTTKPNTNHQLSLIIGEESPYFFGTISTLIGFVSSVVSLYSFFDSLFNPTTSQHTLANVLKKMEVEFTEVRRDLQVIKEMLNKQEMYQFSDVEGAVYGFLNDLEHSSSVDIPSRAVRLYDQLDLLLKGLLGETTGLFPDLLVSVRNFYDCGGGSIQKKIHQFMSLINTGTGGLAFYSRKINNKAIFDGEKRTNALSAKYEAIRKRLNETMKTCATMSTDFIDKNIIKILRQNLESSTQEVSKLLNERFDDIYTPFQLSPTATDPEMRWVFYTAWNFNPSSGDEWVPYSGQSYNIVYTGSGKSGVTKYGGWSVYWIGHPIPYINSEKLIGVDANALVKIAKDLATDISRGRSAKLIQSKISPSVYDPNGRKPVASMIFTFPPTYATTGRDIETTKYRRLFIQRISGFQWFVMRILGHFLAECIIDVVIF